ncbi:MAG: antibiotic biosynthesis monooxygenase [Aestuariivita sp.]|nr:antibiotic biosynthesis monooxygenase [Aestuariivita sp.]
MFLTMNRFKVRKQATDQFEDLWSRRDSHLKLVPGFLAFHLMRGPDHGDYVLYASHTTWKNRDSFENWTKSEAFRSAHKGAGDARDLYLEAPTLECFLTVQSLIN